MSTPDSRSPSDSSKAEHRPWLPYVLALATLCTTVLAGLFQVSDGEALAEVARRRSSWLAALSYAGALLGILIAHEAGHWWTARRRKVSVSLPLLIPGIPPIGTFGAAMRMSLDDMPRSSLLRVAIWGPIAGVVVALPVLWVGVIMSEVRPLPDNLDGLMLLGEPIVLKGMIALVHGPLPDGQDLFLHPVAFAGWTGLLLTALNLFPMSQLDGGHIVHALVGEKSGRVAVMALVLLAGLGLLLYPGWLIVVGLVVLFLGVRHPPIELEGSLTPGDRWLAAVAFLIFVVTFTPTPLVAA